MFHVEHRPLRWFAFHVEHGRGLSQSVTPANAGVQGVPEFRPAAE
jgi:hypothetical protein